MRNFPHRGPLLPAVVGQGGEVPLPPVTPFGTNKPGPRPDSTYDFLGGEEAIAKMKLAPGLWGPQRRG